MNKLRVFVSALIVMSFVFSTIPAAHADETSDIILQLLVKKGLITEQEIADLKTEIQKKKETSAAAGEKPATKEVKKEEDLNVYWKDGLNIRSEDKNFDIKFGGRIFTDIMCMQEDSAMTGRFGDETNTAEIRDARINLVGSVYKDYIYRFEVDFAGGGSPIIKDMYAGMRNIPYLGTFRGGNFKQPVSLEELTSSSNLTFMEKALPNVFVPSYKLGFQFNNAMLDERMSWAISVFNEANASNDLVASGTSGLSTSNEWSLASRLTGIPWYEDKGEKLLHLSINYALRNPEQRFRYQYRPETHMAPYFADTGAFAASNVSLFDYEVAAVYKGLFLQGEFMQNFINKTNSSGTGYFQGCYAQASYFLTGEHRQYDKAKGIFGALRPYKNFSLADRTIGAWEIAARYSYLELKDSGINGGDLNDATLGLNWYLNPNMRVMWNYIHSHRNSVGNADILTARFQVDY